jgi:hypothetical protein
MKMPLSLVEEVKKLQLDQGIDLLAEICQGLLRQSELKRGPQGIQGEPSNIPGPVGPPGRDADVAEVVALARRVMREELESAKDALREIVVGELKASGVIDSEGRAILIPGPEGKPGYTPRKGIDYVDGRDGERGPEGKPGRDGYTPVKGIDYFDGVNGKDSVVPGPRGERGIDGKDSVVPGPVGPQGQPGHAGASLDEITRLIQEIIGTSANEVLQKFVALKQEIHLIENDRRYQRVHSVREEVVERLKQHL